VGVVTSKVCCCWYYYYYYYCLPKPASSPYHEPHEFSLCCPILCLQDSFSYYFPIYAWVFRVVILLQIFPPETLYAFLFSSIPATCPTHLILNLIALILFSEDYKTWSSCLSSFLHSGFTAPHPTPRYLSQQLIVFQPQLMFLFSVRHQALHPHETMGRIIVLYTVIFILWDIKLDIWTKL